MHKLLDLDLNNKNLTIRVDMNVPIKNGIIVDQTRIEACIPTIQKALDNNANVLLVSHLGRPEEGSYDKNLSLQPVAESLSKIFGLTVDLIKHLDDKSIFSGSSPIQILENIRFFDGEKSNSDNLGKVLAAMGDIYVFDAFGTSHREQAST
ncbi:phosphoglycerate kinase, partial [Gammaproteobacteria bacterium]|nr:phosphoglycerate kinase [Gammaproteobacteria bacterium]